MFATGMKERYRMMRHSSVTVRADIRVSSLHSSNAHRARATRCKNHYIPLRAFRTCNVFIVSALIELTGKAMTG